MTTVLILASHSAVDGHIERCANLSD
jgi:hypothetical protein